MSSVTVVSKTQRIIVSAPNDEISVINEGPQGLQGPPGPAGSGGGLPSGGTTGQVLTKSSSVDYASTFANIPAPTGILNTQLNNMPSGTFKGNALGVSSTPQDLSPATVATMLNISPAWIPLNGLYQGGWVDYGAPYGPAKYRKVLNDEVQLRGLIQSGVVGPICTLPVGYRPLYEPIITVACYFGNAEIRINTAGVVSVASVSGTASASAPTWTSLTGVRFSTL